MNGQYTEKKHKSVKLEKSELKKLNILVATFPSKEMAAIAIGLRDRNTLSNVQRKGSGRYDTIEIIREKLKLVA